MVFLLGVVITGIVRGSKLNTRNNMLSCSLYYYVEEGKWVYEKV